MLRSLLRDALVYGASTVLTRAVALALVPIYTRVLAPTDYGAIDILSIFGNLVTLTVALEVTQGVARFLPDADAEVERRRLVSTAMIFSCASYTAFLGIGLLVVDPIRWLTVRNGASTEAVTLALLSIWAIGLFQVAQNVLRFSLQPIAFTISNLTFSFGSLAIGVILVVGYGAGVAGVFTGQLFGGLIGLAVATWFSRGLYAPVFSAEVLRRLLAFSVPLVPASLGVFVTLYIDRIALNQLASLSAVGVFGIGYRLASLVSLLFIGFQMALTPIIYQRYQEPSTPEELARIFRAFVAFALFISLGLSIWAPEILRLATTPAYYAADVVVPLLTPAILLSNMYVFMPGLAIAKQTTSIGTITIAGALLNTVLNLVLIPMLGVRGAAWATLITAVAVFAAYVRGSQRAYPAPHRWMSILFAMGGYIVLVVVGLSVDHGTILGAIIKTLVMGLLIGIVLGARLVRIAEVKSMLGGLGRSAMGSADS